MQQLSRSDGGAHEQAFWDNLRYSVARANTGHATLREFTRVLLFETLLLPALDEDQISCLCKGIKAAKRLDGAENWQACLSIIAKVLKMNQVGVHLVCVQELNSLELNVESSMAVSTCRFFPVLYYAANVTFVFNSQMMVIDSGVCEILAALVKKSTSGLFESVKNLFAKVSGTF
jgi:hypothetical protein